jgi:hypothetical protein
VFQLQLRAVTDKGEGISESEQIADALARKIADYWRRGKFREKGGVIQGMTEIIHAAITPLANDRDRWRDMAHGYDGVKRPAWDPKT